MNGNAAVVDSLNVLNVLSVDVARPDAFGVGKRLGGGKNKSALTAIRFENRVRGDKLSRQTADALSQFSRGLPVSAFFTCNRR